MKDTIGSAGRGANKVIIKVLVLALILILGGYYFRDSIFSNSHREADAHFAGCEVLAEDCIDVVTCGMNVYCGAGIYSDCRIYDCGASYGIATKDAAGQFSFREEAKPDEGATLSVREACEGEMKTLSRKCTDGKMEIELKLTTVGQCEIGNFAVIFKDSGVASSEFTSRGDGVYSIIADACGTIEQIIPAATGGIGLEFEQSEI